MRIAIQGERGSFSHEAALQFAAEGLLRDTEVVPCALSPEVFERAADGPAVIPIENTLAGSVLEHYDLLLSHPVRIRAELLLRIRHCLIAPPGVPLAEVREVYSHPVALAQCRRFFAEHPELRAVPFYDTAGAARHVLGGTVSAAAIAGAQAAQSYGGAILAAGIEDNPANFTRFFLLTPDVQSPTQEAADKVSLAFAVPNRPGSLVAALDVFAAHGLNLSRLESRPVPGSPWQYVFYADYRMTSAATADLALAELAASCLFVKELGRYKAASEPVERPSPPSGA